MSGNGLYNPDRAALDTVTSPWDDALRVQRDVGLLVPINFHVVPSISLKAACFSDNRYSDKAFQKCFSNLLAIGLRRFNIDVYWDQSTSQWSLCPVQPMPSNSNSDSTSSSSSSTPVPNSASSATSISSSGTPGRTSATFPERGATMSSSSPFTATVERRQTTSSSESVPTSSASILTSSQPQSSGTPAGTGPFNNCTTSLSLEFLTDILSNFFARTATTTDATFIFLLLNIHATSPRSSPNSPAEQPTQLPGPGNLISDVIKGNLSADIYTPDELRNQRADLDANDSWLSGNPNNFPEQGYYETHQENGVLVTSEGWPTEAFMVFRKVQRLMVSFGTIDPQMSKYNLAADESTIFPSGTIRQHHPATFGPDGSVTSGCLFVAGESRITESTNSSWAVAPARDISISANTDLTVPIPSVGNLTSCGLSTFLNSSLANTTADQNPLPYAAFIRSYLWTFLPGEPSDAVTANGTLSRCTAMLTTGTYRGRWKTVDCSQPLRIACQDPSLPYRWELSSERSSYGNAQAICSNGLGFSVPHTALENSHLLAAARDYSEPILLNLNSLDVEDCWVAGENTTCPYLPPTDTDRNRVVVVPTVAAVIIFVCAVLTFFVKCAANRREDKRGRRRRMVGGWEYEGVPS